MSVESNDTGSTQTGALRFIDANWHDLRSLPEPTETFRHSDLDPDAQQHFKKLVARGILVSEENRTAGTRKAAIWSTNERCYERLQKRLDEEEDGFLPCGHDPFKNLGDGLLKCKRCGKEHDKEAVRCD